MPLMRQVSTIPRKSRRIVDQHDVERISVIGFGRWHEAPVMG
jgi:hypothetical protein